MQIPCFDDLQELSHCTAHTVLKLHHNSTTQINFFKIVLYFGIFNKKYQVQIEKISIHYFRKSYLNQLNLLIQFCSYDEQQFITAKDTYKYNKLQLEK